MLCFEHISEGDEVIPFDVENRDFSTLNLDRGFFGFGRHLGFEEMRS